MSVITWYGHSAFKIECNGASVLIDPFFAPSTGLTYKDAGYADLVLITHDHGDHVGDAVQICKNGKTMLGAVVGTAEVMVERGVSQSQIYNGIGFNIGGTLEYKGFSITMTQAFHSSDSSVPVGYIIKTADGASIYHAGDTGIFSSMELLGKLYDIRIACLPIGGTFTMDATQAANACRLLNCETAIPMHWGTFPALAQSPREFCELVGEIYPACQCAPMKPLQTIAT